MSRKRLVLIAGGILLVVLAIVLFLRDPATKHVAGSKTGASSNVVKPNDKAGAAAPASVQPAAAAMPDTSAAAILLTNQPGTRVSDREIFASKWGKSGMPRFDEFAAWTEKYVQADEDTRLSLRAAGVELASDRRVAMLDLIKADPREALANAVPISTRRQLPGEVEGLLEERISAIGNLTLVMGMAPPGVKQPVPTNDLALIERRQFFAHRYGARATRNGYSNISIHGVAIDDHLAVSASPVKVLEKGESYTELSEDCVVTDNKQVLAPGDPPDAKSTALLGSHAYVMCCPYCIQAFDEQQTAKEGSVSTPMALSDSGIAGTMGFPGKPGVGLTHGGKGVLFMRVQPSDAVAKNYPFPGWATEASFKDTVTRWDGWDARLKRSSYGKAWYARADVTPVLTLPGDTAFYTGNGYNWGGWIWDARAAATNAGYDLSQYSTYVVCHADYGFGAAGWGAMDGTGHIWANGNFSVELFVHEGGHTFGMPHANSWTSTNADPLSTLSHVEYGDVSCPMGSSWGLGLTNDYNVYYKSLASWLPDSCVLSVTHPGTYRIRQFDSGSILTGSPMALKITRDSGMDFWVSYRGSAQQATYSSGAYVIGTAAGRVADSHVVDMNNPAGDSFDAPLAQGQTFTDAASGISLTTAGRGGVDGDKYLYVKVGFAPGYLGAHRLLVNGGIYAFRNLAFNKCLDVFNNSAAAGAEPVLWDYNGSSAQRWVAWRNDDGSYSLNHFGTDKWLDAANNGGGNYTNIIQWDRNGSDAQRWDVLALGSGGVKLRHRNTNQVLSADTANNGDVITYDDFTGTEQQWEPVLLGMTEGTYRLSPRHAQVLGAGVRNQANYATAQVEQQAWDGGAWQRWTLQSLGNNQFRIYPQGQTGMAMTVSGGGTANGSKVVLMPYSGKAEQKWSFTATGNGWVRLTPSHAPSLCLDVSSVSTSPGADLHVWQYLGGNNQQWQFFDPEL